MWEIYFDAVTIQIKWYRVSFIFTFTMKRTLLGKEYILVNNVTKILSLALSTTMRRLKWIKKNPNLYLPLLYGEFSKETSRLLQEETEHKSERGIYLAQIQNIKGIPRHEIYSHRPSGWIGYWPNLAAQAEKGQGPSVYSKKWKKWATRNLIGSN